MSGFRVFAKGPDAGWSRDWFWTTGRDQHGPYPFKWWAWLAGVFAWVKGGF